MQRWYCIHVDMTLNGLCMHRQWYFYRFVMPYASFCLGSTLPLSVSHRFLLFFYSRSCVAIRCHAACSFDSVLLSSHNFFFILWFFFSCSLLLLLFLLSHTICAWSMYAMDIVRIMFFFLSVESVWFSCLVEKYGFSIPFNVFNAHWALGLAILLPFDENSNCKIKRNYIYTRSSGLHDFKATEKKIKCKTHSMRYAILSTTAWY